MELWFSDYQTEHVKVSVKVEKQLFGEQTDYQRIDVFESKEFGRFISSDGSIVFSEKDEFIYDEMIVHVPMAVHPHVRKVLVIGGGDGGVARELSYYDEIEEIDVVEPDQVFVEVCKKFFPDNACGLEDPRVKVYNADGLRFLRTKNDTYDLIINDAIDPLGHTAGLFTKEFYGNCYRALKEDGIMVYQHGSPFYDEDEESCRLMHRKASHSFPVSRVYQAHIPTCSSGYWLFGFASKKYHPLLDLDAARWKKRGIKTWYYTTNLHKGAFMLPKYVEDMLEEEEKTKAYFMKKQVPNFIKKLRLKKAEKVQEKVMNANNINLIGQETDVIIDYFDYDSNVFVGRTNQNSPDVDFYIIFDDSDKIKAGEIYKAKITEYINGIFKGEILS